MSDSQRWRQLDFRLLLIGQTISQFGAQVSGVAVPLLAVLVLDASPAALGLVTAAGTVAFTLVGLPAGAWIDRRRRRPVLIGSELARAVALATLPLSAVFGLLTMTQLIIVSFLVGVARVFFDVGYQSYLPSIIGNDRLLTGNAAIETVRASGQVLGPGIGGWLVATAGAVNVVLMQAMTSALSAGSLVAIRTSELAPDQSPEPPRWRTEIKEGLVFVARSPSLRAIALTSATGNLAFATAASVSFIFLVRTLLLSPRLIGLLLAAGSVTAMAGAALTPLLARRFGSARIIWLALAATGPLALLTPLAQPGWSVILVAVGTAAGEFGQIVYAISSLSLRQRFCPPQLLGRVNATMRFLIMGLFPLGAALGGILGELVGIRATLLIAGAIVAVSPVPVYLALRGVRDADELHADRQAGSTG
ncbi:MFS transporter [Kribbella capetownensis]|uniref:MFS transporter n=1 Tax=Kribbella capetownensis TaxID=1572659 RepID=A0A4R0IW58_9ACTN|nr:MFS transporter [Kribbella capetownensis]TCC37447.1 MFS transporter [Kribbella capetownensis]